MGYTADFKLRVDIDGNKFEEARRDDFINQVKRAGIKIPHTVKISETRETVKSKVRKALKDRGVDILMQQDSAYMTWTNHTSDMISLSKEFPDILFTLDGHGDEMGDVWRAYFFGGKVQKEEPQIVFNKFDESKLEGWIE